MRILVACEFSGVVREAFRRRGHDAWSCDLLPAEDRSPYHIEDDIFSVLYSPFNHKRYQRGEHGRLNWDLMIAHPQR